MRTRVVALLSLLVSGAAAAASTSLTLTDAWIRATPPGARTAAAYLTITNVGAADRLLGAATPAARRVEVHGHVGEGGVSRMVHLAELALPAGEAMQLAPGGLHLMLIDIAGPLVPGTTVKLSLELAAAGVLEIEVPVVDARTGPPAAHARH